MQPEDGTSETRVDALAERANSGGDADAMVALWDAVFELDAWFLVGRQDGALFVPAATMMDGIPLGAVFTDADRAAGFIDEQSIQAEIKEIRLDNFAEVVSELGAAGIGGLVFNEGAPPMVPFLASLTQLLEMYPVHRPGYGNG